MSINNYGGLSSHSAAATNHHSRSIKDDNTAKPISKYGVTVGHVPQHGLVIGERTWVCVQPDGKPVQAGWPLHYMISTAEHAAIVGDIAAFESYDTERCWVRVEQSIRKGLSFWVLLERSL